MLTNEHVKKLLHGAILYQGNEVIGKISVCRRSNSYYLNECVYFCQNIENGNTVAEDRLGFTGSKILCSLQMLTDKCNTSIVKIESGDRDLIHFINRQSCVIFSQSCTIRSLRVTNIILQHQATLYDFV